MNFGSTQNVYECYSVDEQPLANVSRETQWRVYNIIILNRKGLLSQPKNDSKENDFLFSIWKKK